MRRKYGWKNKHCVMLGDAPKWKLSSSWSVRLFIWARRSNEWLASYYCSSSHGKYYPRADATAICYCSTSGPVPAGATRSHRRRSSRLFVPFLFLRLCRVSLHYNGPHTDSNLFNDLERSRRLTSIAPLSPTHLARARGPNRRAEMQRRSPIPSLSVLRHGIGGALLPTSARVHNNLC